MQDPPELLLSMETSGDVAGVAVLRNGLIIAEHTFRHAMHLSERLLSHVDAVLRDADATLADVDAFAVGIGPGSFTGTRIGVMTMKTLAAVLDKPLVAVTALDTMGMEYAGVPSVVVTPIIPCRNGIVYACSFQVDGAIPVPLSGPAALSLEELAVMLQSLGSFSLVICGPAVARYEIELREALNHVSVTASFGTTAYPRASVAGALALARIASGFPPDDPVSLVPLYVSPPPISTPKEENRPPAMAPPEQGETG